MRKMLITAAASAAALSPLVASAAGTSTLSTTLIASGTIAAGCTALSATPLVFGTFAPSSTPTATGGISATCATGVPATITFAGDGTSALTNTATPNSPTLAYGLFTDTAHSSAIVAAGVTITGSGTAKSTPIYARLSGAVPADTTTGAYTDTIAVTLTF